MGGAMRIEVERQVEGIKITRSAAPINHLMYTDDLHYADGPTSIFQTKSKIMSEIEKHHG